MISLKLYKEASTKVDGSWTDLVNDLVGPDGPGYMHYVVVTKDLDGVGLEQQGTLKWYRFNFNPTNVMNILSKTKSEYILQLPRQFMANPSEVDVAASLPEATKVSIEELEEMFVSYIQGSDLGKANPDGTRELLQRLDWANNGGNTPGFDNLFKSDGGREPGKSPFLAKSLKIVIDDIIDRGHFEPEQRGAIIELLVASNQGTIKYRKDANLRRAEAMAKIDYATTEESVQFYNSITDPNIKRKALYNTKGYINTFQFAMSRTNVLEVAANAGDQAGDLFPEGQNDVFLQEIKIGGRYVVEMLERAKAEIDNSVFEIFNNVKLLKVSLDKYFAGALSDDSKAADAIGASREIEGKTEELRQI